ELDSAGGDRDAAGVSAVIAGEGEVAIAHLGQRAAAGESARIGRGRAAAECERGRAEIDVAGTGQGAERGGGQTACRGEPAVDVDGDCAAGECVGEPEPDRAGTD